MLPKKTVGEAYLNSTSWDTLERLTDIEDRMPGHTGEKKAARVIGDALSDIGARNVEINQFDILGWWRRSSSIKLGKPHETQFSADHELLSLPCSPSGTCSGDLIDVGYGLPHDFEEMDIDGKIVLASSLTPESYPRFVHRREKYHRAIANGAAGFLFSNHKDGCLPATGTIGHRNELGDIPAAGVSKEVGSRLSRLCEKDNVSVELSIETHSEMTQSQNVEAVVGPETESEVLLTAHVDSHDINRGALDNGSGCALVVEVGRLLSHIEDDLDTQVRLITFGAEEIGLIGATHWVETHDMSNVKCIMNFDSPGQSRTPKFNTFEFKGLENTIKQVSSELDTHSETFNEMWGHTDTWPFVKKGVPGVYAHTKADEHGRGWGHTHADTLDKIDKRDLRDLAVFSAATVKKLTEKENNIKKMSVDDVRSLTSEGNEEEMKYLGRSV